jgi:GDPmannose 4,6-dehydratase
MKNTALILGASGQDGAYLAKHLLQNGYRVLGAVRRSASPRAARLQYLGIERDVELFECELLEPTNVIKLVEKTRPREIYNFAAQSFVAASFEQPLFTLDVNTLGAVRILEAIRAVDPAIRFYQASTSEMFGSGDDGAQTETTPFRPRSPYGVSKLAAHAMAVNYRESYGMFCVSGILFNHESPLRGREFVTRRVTLGLAEVKHGRRDCLALGNLDAQRDWGFAGDYVEGMWRMLQQERAGDYVLATGTATRVRDFVALAAGALGFKIAWEGTGRDERGIDRNTGRAVIRVDPALFRPAEVHALRGSPAKAAAELGWAHRVEVPELAAMMAAEDDRRVRDGLQDF